MEKVVYVDANVFLEVLLEQERSDECELLLNKVASNELQAVISQFSVHSIALILDRFRSPADIRTFLTSLSSYQGLSIYTPSLTDAVVAIDNMKKWHLSFEDALVLQCCIASGCDVLVSFESDFKNVKAVRIATPDQAMSL